MRFYKDNGEPIGTNEPGYYDEEYGYVESTFYTDIEYPKTIDVEPIKTFDSDGKLHSINDEPSFYMERYQQWHEHGILHRVNKPASISRFYSEPEKIEVISYYQYNELHRDNGPAVIQYKQDGSLWKEEWWTRGVKIKENIHR